MRPTLPTQSDKPRFVAAMFGRIAARYDVMNTLITAGQDGAWRHLVAETLLDGTAARAAASPQTLASPDRAAPTRPDRAAHAPPLRLLDVGCGTGKLALALADQAPPEAKVIGVDFAQPMLRAAPRRLRLAAADALQLPFGPASFDGVASAFLLRNVADLSAAVSEQLRVLRPGSRLVILETTPGPGGLLQPLFRFYFRRIVPLLGRLVAGDAAAYTYLPESSLAFLDADRLADLLCSQGLTDLHIRRLGFGSLAITSGRKP